MSVTEFPDLALAREEAAGWVARLDRGLSPAERAELRAWCAASPANARALRQFSDLWMELDMMKALADVFPEGLGTPLAGEDAANDAPAAQAPARRRLLRPALAASLVLVLLAAGGFAWLQQRDAAGTIPLQAMASAESIATEVGQQRSHQLADGSSIAINTGSLVEVLRLDEAARELRLQRGEALFSVAHDPDRPFRVNVGGHVVEAVGTEFDIRLHEDGEIDVVVSEGRVRLSSGDAVTGLIEHGQALRIGSDGRTRLSRLDEDELAARLAWRRGMIEFRGQPLEAALREFSRYTPVRFVVTDATAARTPIGGSVPAGDVEWLLEALHSNFGLESSRAPDGSIRISPKR